MSELELIVNGQSYSAYAPVGTSLAQLLREELGFTGTKIACNEGHCGACTVQIDGVPTLSCITLAHLVSGEARGAGGTRIALAGVAPVPWLLDGPEGLEAATPLPRTAWKVDVARALVRRAVTAVSAE